MPRMKGRNPETREDRVIRQAQERLQGALEDPDCEPFLCVDDALDFVIGGLDDTVSESETEHIRLMIEERL
jgi:hypothetical protein